jgi:choline dehydrogenase-like flavoprotein
VPVPAAIGGGLTPARRATLAAVVVRVLDGALDLAPGLDAAALVEARLLRAPVATRSDLVRVLDVFGSRAAACLTLGIARPFAALDAARQDRMLQRWARSRLGVQRTVFQALRRLTLAVWYGHPEVQSALGHRGPLHRRTPALPWEGPADGVSTPTEPIVRTGAPERVAPPVRSAELPVVDGAATGTDRGRITPGRAIAGERRRTADVVVVGSGAGGAVVAARLAEAGLEVVVLESGGLWTADEFTEQDAEMAERLYAEQGLRATVDLGVAVLQGSTVGGSTTVNWMAMLRPGDHVRAEWARRFGLGVMTSGAFDAALDHVWGDVRARPMPDDAQSPNNRLLLDGAHALGWRVRALDLNARGCVRSGFCGQGCRYDAKQGTLVTYVPRALAAGAAVYADAEVASVTPLGPGIQTDPRGLGGSHSRPPVKRVHAVLRDRDTGRVRGTLTVDAPYVVLAGGAVGTPALLQRSGLGGGGVGRYLRLHPTTAVTGLYDREIGAGAGVPMTSICDEFTSGGPGGYGFWIETPPVHPALAGLATSGFGRAHAERARLYPTTGTLITLVRDGADPDASNGSVTVDRAGRTRLRYRLGDVDARHLREGMAACARLHLAAGAREAHTLHTDAVVVRREADVAEVLRRSVAPNDVTVFSAHVNGTCRLGTDPRTSGAASDGERLGERHGAPGIYVADGSLLPTGLGVNPQATIMALAHLVADGIVARWR